jgi:hypothetical protein
MANLTSWSLMPGAEIVELSDGTTTRRIQFGVPPCLKLWQQKRLPPPTEFVLPDTFFRQGVVQACLEFFAYNFLFVLGKAFGKLPDQKLIVYGTLNQIARARRMLEVTLLGFSEPEMASWPTSPAVTGMLDRQRKMTAWFAAKQVGFTPIQAFISRLMNEYEYVQRTGSIEREDLETELALARTQTTQSVLFQEFVTAIEAHLAKVPWFERTTVEYLTTFAYEFATLKLDDFIDWVNYSPSGRIDLTPEYVINRQGNNQFEVVGYTFDEVKFQKTRTTIPIDLNFTEAQAPYLITLPPQTAPVTPAPLKVLCLGSDSGDLTHRLKGKNMRLRRIHNLNAYRGVPRGPPLG